MRQLRGFQFRMSEKKQSCAGPDRGRRAFLRKAAYTAPALVVLGLAGTREVSAQDCDPLLDPNCTPPTGPLGFEEDRKAAPTKGREEFT